MVAPTRFRFKAEYEFDDSNNPIEDGAKRAFGYVPAYHKRSWRESPYRIPNEFICTRLGELIGLPVAPCVLTYSEAVAEQFIFSSLNFNADKHKLPPVEPEFCVKHLPWESAGVVIFDIWIANEDPKLMQVFDHDQALFGGTASAGCERLEKLRLRLGMTGSTITGNNRHCLLDWLTSSEHFGQWTNIIWNVPDFVIQRLFHDLLKCKLISNEECDKGTDFLITRKKMLAGLISNNQREFTGITNWNPSGEIFPS